jgi:hypothetical protein
MSYVVLSGAGGGASFLVCGLPGFLGSCEATLFLTPYRSLRSLQRPSVRLSSSWTTGCPTIAICLRVEPWVGTATCIFAFDVITYGRRTFLGGSLSYPTSHYLWEKVGKLEHVRGGSALGRKQVVPVDATATPRDHVARMTRSTIA